MWCVHQSKIVKKYRFFSCFNKISTDLDSALSKNAAVNRSKFVEVEDATNYLMATQSCFRYTALDYVYQVDKKKLNSVISKLKTIFYAR